MSIDVNLLKLMFQFLTRSRILKRMYYDIAASTDIFVLRALAEYIKPSRILFGSNYIWTPSFVIPSFFEDLQNYDGFNNQTIIKIEYENALKLFPNLKGAR